MTDPSGVEIFLIMNQIPFKILTLFFAFSISTSSSIAFADVYQDIFNQVNQGHLQDLLRDMTGSSSVTLGGKTFSINDRYLPASKANFRAYWSAYYRSLGLNVFEQNYKTKYNLEKEGHNLEVVLPGKSADSVIIIVHYDSIGPHGADNPGVDDDMTGMSVQMETARILMQYKGHLNYTVRFVAADYEEWGSLEGARVYAKYIKAKAQVEGFKIIAGIDDEQSGWKQGADKFDIFSCGGPTDSKAMGDIMEKIAIQFGKLGVKRGCIGENSDHYALWEIGVQSVVFSEHSPFSNPHFDAEGGDLYELIDQNYFFQIAQVGVVFAAKIIGVE